MILNRRAIVMEMTHEEHRDISLSLRKYVEHCHISFLLSQDRDSSTEPQIKFAERNLKKAIASYEMFSGETYDMRTEEFIIRDNIPVLRKSF